MFRKRFRTPKAVDTHGPVQETKWVVWCEAQERRTLALEEKLKERQDRVRQLGPQPRGGFQHAAHQRIERSSAELHKETLPVSGSRGEERVEARCPARMAGSVLFLAALLLRAATVTVTIAVLSVAGSVVVSTLGAVAIATAHAHNFRGPALLLRHRQLSSTLFDGAGVPRSGLSVRALGHQLRGCAAGR